MLSVAHKRPLELKNWLTFVPFIFESNPWEEGITVTTMHVVNSTTAIHTYTQRNYCLQSWLMQKPQAPMLSLYGHYTKKTPHTPPNIPKCLCPSQPPAASCTKKKRNSPKINNPGHSLGKSQINVITRFCWISIIIASLHANAGILMSICNRMIPAWK